MAGKSNRDRNHEKCIQMLHAEDRYFSTLSAPTIRNFQNRVVETGYPDITAARWGRIAYIECKADHKSDPLSISLDQWTEMQRKWALWVRTTCQCEYWLFLTMGAGRVGIKDNPDRSWLVPYEAWLSMEALVRPVQATLVYAARPGMALEIQGKERQGSKVIQTEKPLDAITLLACFEVQWIGGRWHVPEDHVFHGMYLAQQPQSLAVLETSQCRTSPILSSSSVQQP